MYTSPAIKIWPTCPVAYTMERLPMPATDEEIEELRHLMRWAEGLKGPIAEKHADMLRDGLRRAMKLIDRPKHINIAKLLLAAIKQAGHWDSSGNFWIIHDRELYNWAIREIEKFDLDSHAALQTRHDH